MVPYARSFAPALLLLTALPFAGAEDSFEDVLKRTDQSNPEAVFALAEWCKERNLTSKARQYYFQVIKLDKDHAEARAAIGQVRVGDRWVAKNLVKDDPAKPQGAAPAPKFTGPAPKASDVSWNLTVPKDPTPGNRFVDSYIARMPTVANDSGEMELAVSTLLTPDNLPTALPRVCAALLTPAFTDLYGPSDMVQGLLRDGRRADARTLFPFIVAASSRSTDVEDLSGFAYAAAQMRDKRAMPRLIELMEHENKDLAEAAAVAAAAVTGLPKEGMTPDKAKSWWARFHATDEVGIMRAQLASKDAETSIAAAAELGQLNEKKALDVLIEWMRNEDPKIAGKAHLQVTGFTGRDWSYMPTDPLDQRLKRVEVLSKWWKENRENFTLQVDPRLRKASSAPAPEAAVAVDPAASAVRDLSSTDAKAAAGAESLLAGKGTAAVPFLIAGLGSDSPITSRKCHELLQRASKKSDIAFNPRDPAEKRQQAIDAWRTWAIAQKLMTDDTAEDAEPPAEQ